MSVSLHWGLGSFPLVVAASLVGLFVGPVTAQDNRPGVSGRPPQMQAGRPVPRPAVQPSRSIDLLDVRDRITDAPQERIETVQTASVITCFAGCDGQKSVISAVTQGAPIATLMKVSAPVASNGGSLVLASLSDEPTSQNATAAPSGVIECVAGCYDGDRRSLRATGGPIPAVTIASLGRPNPLAVATPKPAAPKLAAQPVKLRAAHAPHVVKRHAAKRSHRMQIAKTKPNRAVMAAAVAPTAPTTVPAPVAAAVTPTPAAAAAEPKPVRKVAALPPKPRATVTTDWFNRINREREAKAAANKAATNAD